MKRLNQLPLLIVCLLLPPASARAGNVSGTVRDLVTRNGFSNAEVKIDNIADTTDVNGNFSLISVPNGYKTLVIKPLDSSHLYVSQDSVNVNGNITFNAALPETTFLNNDGSRARVKANELKNVHGVTVSRPVNPYLFDVSTDKNIPTQVTGFNSSDSTAIWNTLMWLNNKDSTFIKFIPGIVRIDTTRGIKIIPGSGNQTSNLLRSGFIFNSLVELTTTDPITDAHEAGYHGRSYPSPHVTTYSPSNYVINPNVMPQPKDMAYMNIAYLLQGTRQDSINNVFMSCFQDSVTIGVEIEPKLVMPVRNNGLILHTPYPNPARGFVNLDYSLDRPRRVEISLFNTLGQMVGKARGAGGPGAHAFLWDVSRVPAGVYFLVLGDGHGQAVTRFMVVH